jgi:hypothetical protein
MEGTKRERREKRLKRRKAKKLPEMPSLKEGHKRKRSEPWLQTDVHFGSTACFPSSSSQVAILLFRFRTPPRPELPVVATHTPPQNPHQVRKNPKTLISPAQTSGDPNFQKKTEYLPANTIY